MGMFCYQCEQTAGGKGCAGKAGVCGKTEEVALLQDALTKELIGLACAYEGKAPAEKAVKLMLEGLFTTVTNVSFDAESIRAMIGAVQAEKAAAAPGLNLECDHETAPLKLWSAEEGYPLTQIADSSGSARRGGLRVSCPRCSATVTILLTIKYLKICAPWPRQMRQWGTCCRS